MAYIQVEQATHLFQVGLGEHSVPALKDVTFEVQRGEFVSLLGPSGCGKTTLLRIMHGLVRPTSGRILADGKEVQGPETRRAMVFQDFGLLPWRTTLQNIEMGLEFQGAKRESRRKVALEMVKVVGLLGFEKRYPYQLSGGMKQRVGLARALSISPDSFLMDEPFASLDAQMRELMQEELLRIWAQFKTTVVFVTHSIDEALYLSDRVIVMTSRPGRVKIKENPDQVLRAVRATVKGCKYTKDPKNRAEIVKLMMDSFKLTQDVAEKTYDLAIDTVSEDGIAREEAVQTDIDLGRELMGKKEAVPRSQVINYSFVRKLKEGR